ncbi:MAG: tetratricopeptide repeat protein [Terracidiphilus sp.]
MNARYQTAIILMIAVFALGEGMVMAQQNEVPILKPKTKLVTATTLLVMCDLACNWNLDGEIKGRIDAGGAAKAKVELGQHALVAVTDDGLDKVEKDIEIKTAGQTIFRVELQPVRNGRIQAQQDADPVYLRDHAAQRAKEGQELYDQKEYKQAKPLLEKACSGGAMAGCVTLGDILEHENDLGTDPYKNLLAARSLYQKACDSGVLRGCTMLGSTYEFGEDSDYNKASRLFQKACDGGDTWGCCDLGSLYESGYGVIRDIPKARALYQKACLDGLGLACDNLRRLQ